MGEYIPASIRLGGKLKRSDAAELIDLINGYDLTSQEDEEPASEANLGHEFYGGQINYGNLDEITSFAQAVGLSYVSWFDSGYEWTAETTRYDAATGLTLVCSGSLSEGFSLTERQIREHGSLEAVYSHFEQMKAPLPVLEIVDDE